MEDKKLVEVQNLKQYFPVAGGKMFEKKVVKAVDNVSFFLNKGETLGLVGESGCGKTTTGRSLLRLHEPTSGRIIYDGETIFDSGDVPLYGEDEKPRTADGKPVFGKKTAVNMLPYRRKMQIVFQDPYASLNPRMSIFDIIAEPLIIHGLTKSKKELEDRVMELLRKVGLDDYHANRYPHEFSGGQRQRIGIARALAVEPELIIADEPVSALDVSIQAQVLNLLHQLQKEFNLTYIFVAHDLSVVEHISDRVGVMYLGNFVEVGDKRKLYSNPLHPYTQALLSAVPVPDPTAKKDRIILEGSIPSALNPPSGCKFHTRCPRCMDICKQKAPERYQVSDDHYVYCHLYDDKIKENKG